MVRDFERWHHVGAIWSQVLVLRQLEGRKHNYPAVIMCDVSALENPTDIDAWFTTE